MARRKAIHQVNPQTAISACYINRIVERELNGHLVTKQLSSVMATTLHSPLLCFWFFPLNLKCAGVLVNANCAQGRMQTQNYVKALQTTDFDLNLHILQIIYHLNTSRASRRVPKENTNMISTNVNPHALCLEMLKPLIDFSRRFHFI